MRDTPELQAFTAECEAAETTLRAAPAGVEALPGLGEWSLGALVGHLVGVAGRLLRYDVVAAAPTVDRVGYYAAEPPPGHTFADEPLAVADWGEQFARAWQATVARCRELNDDVVLATPLGRIRAVEYLATRVLEVVVHHMDVRAALDLPPAGTIHAERITQALLAGLLDGPRPRNLGRTRFILAATGRVAFDDPRFPVLR